MFQVSPKNPEDEARLVSIQKQVDKLEGRQKEAITEAIKKLAKGVDDKFKFFNTSLEIIKERVEHLESLEDQEDEEEEEVELEENFKKTNKERNEEAAEEKTQIFIKKSLQILDVMEKEVQKLRKNACQKDIKEKFMLYWNKIENELKNLDPIAFVRHHDCEVEVNKMKLVLSESEKSGTKFDKEEVTVNMIAETMAHEFPEFVFAFAEENFLRGYQLGLDDAYKTLDGKTPDFTTKEQ